MSKTKSAQAFIDACNFMKKVSWGDCTCSLCKSQRQQEAMPKALFIVYPDINILPMQWVLNDSNGEVVHILRRAHTIRDSNANIKKMQDLDATMSGQDQPNLFFCHNCGILHSNSHIIKDRHFCSVCGDDLSDCGSCGKLGNRRKMLNAKIGGKVVKVCKDCSNKMIYCNYCGYMYEANLVIFYDQRRFEDGSMEKSSICIDCNDKNSFICKCGTQTHSSVSRRDGSGDHVCPACAEEDQGMQPYYFKPMRLYFQTGISEGVVTEGAFHMGFEIEIAMRYSNIDQNSMTHLLKEKFGKNRIYCMHDGTIESASGYSGLEVVSHPFTWQYYKEIAYKWDEMLIFLRLKGWKANFPGVGFHIHTTKAAWGSFQIYKLLQLIYKNKEWACVIAQRKPTTYCTMNSRDFDEAVLVAKDKKNRKPDHYSAINLNNGNGTASKTIEFRMFQGSLEPLYFHKNIEFVRSCYQYTKNYRDMSIGGFTAYVNKNIREYPCLNEFLKMKGI